MKLHEGEYCRVVSETLQFKLQSEKNSGNLTLSAACRFQRISYIFQGDRHLEQPP